jgi:NitT/TauT family transport system substrate-binding protein
MKRRFWGIATALAVTAALATACSNAQGSQTSSSGVELHSLNIAAVPAADSAGLYIAVQDGLFAAQGLHVNITPAISSETVIDKQLAGKYDITSGNYVSYILANVKQQANFEILAAGSIMQPQVQQLMIPPGSPIRTVSQLKGKTIALNAPNGIGQLLVSATLTANMVSPSSVKFTTIQFPNMAAALKDHKVAAAFMPQPFVTNAEDSVGAEPLADLDQGAVTSLPISGYVVTKSWLQKYPKTAAAFRKALEEAQRIADTDPGAVEKAMVTYSPGVTRTAAAIMASPQFPLDTDPVLIQRVADLMQEFGLLQQSYNVTPMIP